MIPQGSSLPKSNKNQTNRARALVTEANNCSISSSSNSSSCRKDKLRVKCTQLCLRALKPPNYSSRSMQTSTIGPLSYPTRRVKRITCQDRTIFERVIGRETTKVIAQSVKIKLNWSCRRSTLNFDPKRRHRMRRERWFFLRSPNTLEASSKVRPTSNPLRSEGAMDRTSPVTSTPTSCRCRMEAGSGTLLIAAAH